jgi:predicted AAA+ superfamily ATPase
LAISTNISRPKIYEYLAHLENAKIINSIRSKEKGYKVLSKPEKLFMQNTNISYAITANIDIGSARESFFVNQIKNYYASQNLFLDESIYISNKGDFLVNDIYIFEVGGKKKSFKQIKDLDNSFVASDDIEIGFKNKIPLWLFGFLY